MPEQDGPDMTPQGLADAVNDLVRDLSQRRGERSGDGTWQQILAEQALNAALDTNSVLWVAVIEGVREALCASPALLGAIEAAWAVEGAGTAFQERRVGVLVRIAARQARRDLELYALQDDEEETGPDDAGTPETLTEDERVVEA